MFEDNELSFWSRLWTIAGVVAVVGVACASGCQVNYDRLQADVLKTCLTKGAPVLECRTVRVGGTAQ